jgi:5-methylcytosine-specific restriction endonuclease McrA
MVRWRHTETRQARGYGADWQRLRAAVLAAEPLCRMCQAVGRTTAATEVDHIEPFDGVADPRRLDRANCRPLCTPCHRSRTARQASGVADWGCDANGIPLDERHPWHKR